MGPIYWLLQWLVDRQSAVHFLCSHWDNSLGQDLVSVVTWIQANIHVLYNYYIIYMNTYDRWVQMMQMKHARAKWILGRLGSASMDLDSVNPYVFELRNEMCGTCYNLKHIATEKKTWAILKGKLANFQALKTCAGLSPSIVSQRHGPNGWFSHTHAQWVLEPREVGVWNPGVDICGKPPGLAMLVEVMEIQTQHDDFSVI